MDYEKFSDLIQVTEKAEKTGAKGVFYSLKTEKGLVYNVSKKVSDTFGGILVGQSYWMDGVILPPKEGSSYTKGSRWVNAYSNSMDGQRLKEHEEAKKTQTNLVSVQKPTTPTVTNHPIQPLNGAMLGNHLNNAVALTVAQMDKGIVGCKNSEVKMAIKFWVGVFKDFSETGDISLVDLVKNMEVNSDEVPF